jgi:WD40 repeat protein
VTGTTVTCIARDRFDNLLFGGSRDGNVNIFDVTAEKGEHSLLHSIQFHSSDASQASTNRNIAAVVFNEETRLLFVAQRNNLNVCEICAKRFIKNSQVLKTFSFHESCQLTALCQTEPYFIAICGSDGEVALFDYGNADWVSSFISTGRMRASSTTIKSELPPWHAVIKRSDHEIRDWLRGQQGGEFSSLMRTDLIENVCKVAKVDPIEGVVHLRPITPMYNALVGLKLDSPSGSIGAALKDKVSILQENIFLRCLLYLKEFRLLVIGCDDGTIQLIALNHLLGEISKGDKDDYRMMRMADEIVPAEIKPIAKMNKGERAHHLRPGSLSVSRSQMRSTSSRMA